MIQTKRSWSLFLYVSVCLLISFDCVSYSCASFKKKIKVKYVTPLKKHVMLHPYLPYRLPLYNCHLPLSPKRPSWRSPAVSCIYFQRDYPQTSLEVRNTLKLEERFWSSIATWKLKLVGHYVLHNIFFSFWNSMWPIIFN